jgi:hypothetical protein
MTDADDVIARADAEKHTACALPARRSPEELVEEIRERWAGWRETTSTGPDRRSYGWATWWWDDGERVEARFWCEEGRLLAIAAPGDVRTLLAEIERLRRAPEPSHD